MRGFEMDQRAGERTRVHTLELGGREVTLEIRSCRVCLGGEFAGNIDLTVACDPQLAESLARQATLTGALDPKPSG
jgi:hypothetical protein